MPVVGVNRTWSGVVALDTGGADWQDLGMRTAQAPRLVSTLERASLGAVARIYLADLVDEILQRYDRTEERKRALPARLMVYFVIAMALFRLRAQHEQRLAGVVDAEGIPRGSVARGQVRTLTTTFGDVDVERLAYRQRGHGNLFPADVQLNLPEEQYSQGLRRLAAIEASKTSFGATVEAVREATAAPRVELPKRQLEELVQHSAVDFDAFYAQPDRPTAQDDVVLGLSFDGKGIVRHPAALRAETAAAAARSTRKLATRLSKGEKANRRRMAEVAAVFDVSPVPRTPADILAPPDGPRKPAPPATGKWLTVSVALDAGTVIAQAFDEAARRDPQHRRTWLALVDGNNDQINHIRKQARARMVQVVILVDFIHVLEYLWKAAWCFYDEGSPAAAAWVREKGIAVLEGNSGLVAAAVRRKATYARLAPQRRKAADDCAGYLLRKGPCLDYPTALHRGWPIATGVIEGACRHLVKDRMDITGARWGLDSAEAVLKIRALRANGDFARYWKYHLAQEQHRVHEPCYAGQLIPRPNPTLPS